MGAPFLYRAYVAGTALVLPFAARRVIAKLRNANVPTFRAHEVLGHATEPREGIGPLIWFHAASVGESLSVLSLITAMGERLPRARFLITTGTPTSAELVEKRMPPRCVHQFAPLDAGGPIRRFLKHWRPTAAVFVESELWPQLLRRTHAQGARMALVNARLSARSQAAWRKRPALAAYVFEVFDLILTQNDAMAQAMVDMHAPPPRVARGINLKSLSEPLPVDRTALSQLGEVLADRPVWVASSTHEGEEQAVLAAHTTLLTAHPDACLILAPRHPERRSAVSALIREAGLTHTTRSKGERPTAQVYLADTLGELGLWYGLSPRVFLGGSLLPIGGHNPFEVAQAGGTVLTGPHVTNFAETFGALEAEGGCVLVNDAADLARELDLLFEDTTLLERRRAGVRRFVAGQAGQLGSIADRLIKALDLDTP